jgi:hypothetical protein
MNLLWKKVAGNPGIANNFDAGLSTCQGQALG